MSTRASPPPHPYGVRPRGNYYADCASGPVNLCRSPGLGALGVLSDELLIKLLGQLGPRDLCTLSIASRALLVFCNHDELWRSVALERFGADDRQIVFVRSWKQTFQSVVAPSHKLPPQDWRPISVRGFYSDLLFQPWLCSSAGLDPRWTAVDNLPRRAAAELSRADFVREYEEANKPVLQPASLY